MAGSDLGCTEDAVLVDVLAIVFTQKKTDLKLGAPKPLNNNTRKQQNDANKKNNEIISVYK